MAQIYSGKKVLSMAEKTAVDKASIPLPHLVLLGIAAGAYIALGGGLATFVGTGMPALTEGNPALAKLLSGAFYLPVALFEGAGFSLSDMPPGNLLPVTLGNIVGGGLFWSCFTPMITMKISFDKNLCNEYS